ncbi:MAG: Hypothetical protein YaeJ with similarity to translation release factor, partial [uncultured Solirubrobacteraceae bacterium]
GRARGPAAHHARGGDPPAGGRAAREPLLRARRPARERHGLPDRGLLRRRGLREPHARPAGPDHVPRRPGGARRRPGRPVPAAQPRARAGAAPGPPGPGAARPPQPDGDPPHPGLAPAPPRGQAAGGRAQAGPPAPDGGRRV